MRTFYTNTHLIAVEDDEFDIEVEESGDNINVTLPSRNRHHTIVLTLGRKQWEKLAHFGNTFFQDKELVGAGGRG